MGIQNCLEKKKFRNAYHHLVVSILMSSAWVNEKMKTVLSEEDITLQQYNILCILYEHECPLSILQIRDAMIDKMSDASRIVDRLVIKGMVNKTVCKLDKRLVDIFITEEGSQLLCRLTKHMSFFEETFCGMDEDEANQLIALLQKMRKE